MVSFNTSCSSTFPISSQGPDNYWIIHFFFFYSGMLRWCLLVDTFDSSFWLRVYQVLWPELDDPILSQKPRKFRVSILRIDSVLWMLHLSVIGTGENTLFEPDISQEFYGIQIRNSRVIAISKGQWGRGNHYWIYCGLFALILVVFVLFLLSLHFGQISPLAFYCNLLLSLVTVSPVITALLSIAPRFWPRFFWLG